MPGQLFPHERGLAQITPPPGVQQQNRNPNFSNVYKWYNNWNLCFSCGFDVENGHMSTTSVVFDNDKCDVMFNGKVILHGYRDPTANLWMLPITNKVCTAPVPTVLPRPGLCLSCAPHLPFKASNVHPGVTLATFTHSVQTRSNAIKFAHQSQCNPKILTLLKAVHKGFLKGCPNLSETLLLRYLNPSLAMAKGHMKQPCHSIQSTRHHTAPVAQLLPPVLPFFDNIPVYPRPVYSVQPGPNVIADDADKSIANIFCFGAFADRNSGIVYHDLTGLFPFMSFNGSVYFLYSTIMNPMPSLQSPSPGWTT